MSIYKSIHPKSTRTLLVEQSPYTEGVRLEVSGTNRSGRTVSEARVVLTTDKAVELALDLLKRAGREDLLAPPPPYVPLAERVGEYVINEDGVIVKITGPVARPLPEQFDEARGITANGTIWNVYNKPNDGEIWWTPVEVKVTPPTPEKWEVVE